MGKFILFLDRLINLYLYYIVLTCFISLIPNINPNYPLFYYLFKLAGFYILPPIFGIIFCPMLIMVAIVLTSMGLKKIYIKYFFKPQGSPIVFITKDEFEQKINEELLKQNNTENEENNGN